MKVCHVVIVCSLTALLTILDLPLGSCDDVIIQKRVSTDGGKETLIRSVLTTEILVLIEPLVEYFKGNSIHIHSQKEYGRAVVQGASRRSCTRSGVQFLTRTFIICG
jgi:hypothetical protein